MFKIKMLLHAIIGMVSFAFAGIMLLETHCNNYPDIFCWMSAVIAIISGIYSSVFFCKCADKVEGAK